MSDQTIGVFLGYPIAWYGRWYEVGHLLVLGRVTSGGKRYDLAVQGRRLANATFFESHEVDRHTQLAFAMDLTPLVADPSLDVASFTTALVDRMRGDVADRIGRMSRTK